MTISGVDFKYKNITCEDKTVRLQIWDTAGQEKFRSIVQTYYKGAMGIILVYSINDRRSFENIENWMKQILANTDNDTIVLLIGNKADVEDREVEKSEGENLAAQYKIQFFETSAKTGQNIQETFFQITKDIKQKVGENPVVAGPKRSLMPQNSKSESNNVTLASIQVTNDMEKVNKSCKC